MRMNKKDTQAFVGTLNELCNQLIELLFPRRCPACDHVVPFGQLICARCEKAFEKVGENYCFKCGKQIRNERNQYCLDCDRKQHKFVSGRSIYVYRGAIVPSLYRFKYAKRQEYAEYYGKMITKELARYIRSTGAQVLIPVPLHKRRLAKRGYNQAAVLAKAISKYSGIPVCEKAVERTRNTIPQKLLDEQGRQNNLKKAFKLGQNVVKSKVTIVIDDIYTTGSTIDAVSEVLYSAGAKEVYFITLAAGREI